MILRRITKDYLIVISFPRVYKIQKSPSSIHMTLELKEKSTYKLLEEKQYGLSRNRLAYLLILKFIRKHEKNHEILFLQDS